MPHADSSYFAPGSSKEQVYDHIVEHTRALTEGQRNWVRYSWRTANLANAASLLWHGYGCLPSPSSSVNWAGFYIRADKLQSATSSTGSPDLKRTLLLGPFQGKPACQWIKFGKGVCGTSADRAQTVIVPDVLEWEGHIACDAESRSEIVVPIVVDAEVVAIIDVDCTEANGFDEIDKKGLEALAALLAVCCDW
ncbi:hypothetical protein FQN57_006261 [Myotisia sp. PD_48]|nr:hypothetical protein FQN57_006261 [Myotisia sp. PD_48]